MGFKVTWSGDKKFKRFLKDYGKLTDQTSKELVLDMAKRGGKALATAVEPRGMARGKAKKVLDNAIDRGINKVYSNVGKTATALKRKSRRLGAAYLNYIQKGEAGKADKLAARHLGFASGGFDGGKLHQQERVKGSIPRHGYKSTGSNNRAAVEAYKKREKASSGLAKAAWIAGVNQLKGKKLKFQAWLMKNAKRQHGTGKARGYGKGYTVTLTNKIKYTPNLLPPAKIDKAMKANLRNTIKFYQRQLDHAKK